MRWLLPYVMLLFLVVGCNQNSDTCPDIWELDKGQVSAYAKVDSGQLVLEVWNPASPHAIQLSQEYLQGDFEVSIQLMEMQWDSLIRPQFRLEVYNLSNPEERLSGVAVQPNVFYCYVGGTDTENRDDRLVDHQNGVLKVTRSNGWISSYANIGGTELTFTDTLHTEDMGVRLVFGSTEVATGRIQTSLSDFSVRQDWPNADIQAPPVHWDQFACQSW